MCEIIENRFELMHNTYNINPWKCNSASTLNKYAYRYLTKNIIALPTSNTVVEILEKTITGGFSGVNARFAFDTEILLPNYNSKDYEKVSIDESFKSHNRQDLKACYKIKLDGEETYKDRYIVSKILKVDESNQYGYPMAKPMSTVCIKEKKIPLWKEINIMLKTVDLNDKIGHLFIMDIKFNEKNAAAREYMCNEIYPPLVGKHKILEANEWSIFSLLSNMQKLSKEFQKLTNTQKNLMQQCLKKIYSTVSQISPFFN